VTKLSSESLLKRLQDFALQCLRLVNKLPKTGYNREYGNQLIRSSASPGSNYIEAIEAGSRRGFIHRLRICRKESRESIYWLELIQRSNKNLIEITQECPDLIKEAREFIKIFTSSVLTAEKNQKIDK